MGSNRYSQYHNHPLCDIPQGVLDAARACMNDAAKWKDVDPDLAEVLADSVVLAIIQAGYKILEDQ